MDCQPCNRFACYTDTRLVFGTDYRRKKLGEICAQYLHKGSLVYISGRMQTRKWQDQSGVDRYTTEIVAREMKMLDGKKDSSQQQQESWNPQPQRMVPEAYVPF